MDLNPSAEQQMLVDAARRFFADRAPLANARELEARGRGLDRSLWTEMARLGWIAVDGRERGSGLGFVDAVLLAEEMGRALAPPALVPTVMGTALLETLAGEPQRRRWLPAIAAGEAIVTLAIAEPGARSLWESPRLALADGCLTGRKVLVPLADEADLLLVATAGGAVAVERGARGVARTRQQALGGEPVWEVHFEDASGEELAGEGIERAPSAPLARALDRGAVAALAYLVGMCERALEMTVAHARTREQFGRPIGGFQAVAHRAADMRADVDAMRVLVHQAAWSLSRDRPDDVAVGSALAYALPAGRRVFRHAHQVHGAIGFATEHDLPLFSRRAKAVELTWGPASLHEERVAGAIGIA